jgi:hypothetical protein
VRGERVEVPRGVPCVQSGRGGLLRVDVVRVRVQCAEVLERGRLSAGDGLRRRVHVRPRGPMIPHVKITLLCENCGNSSTHPLIPDHDNSIETKMLGGFGSTLVHVARYHEHHSKCEPPTYTVQEGDSPANIAGRCGVDWRRWKELCEFNGKRIQPAIAPGTDLGGGYISESGAPEHCTLIVGEVLKLPPGWRFELDDAEPQ